MQLDGITPGGGHEHRREPRGIKVVNDGAMDISDRFSSDRGHNASGIYSKPRFARDGCGCPDDSAGGGAAPSNDYDGCGAVHHYPSQGSSGGSGSAIDSGPDSHHLDPPKPDYDGCGGGPTYNGWPLPSGC